MTLLGIGGEKLRRENPKATAIILEVWVKNVEIWAEKLPSCCEMIFGDIRNVKELFDENSFRVVYWNNGPEHVAKSEIEDIIDQLKYVVSDHIILEYPKEYYQQGIAFGNPYEQHLWYPTPDIFEAMGFETELFGIGNSQVRSIWRKGKSL